MCRVCHRHNAGNDRHIYARPIKPVKEVIKNVVVKKHLRGEKFTTARDFLFQSVHVLCAVRTFGMSLRIAGAADTKSAERGNFLGELTCVMIRNVAAFKVFGNVSPQSQNILDTFFAERFQFLLNPVLVGGDTGKMRKRRYAAFVQFLTYGGGIGGSSASGAVGDAHIAWL